MWRRKDFGVEGEKTRGTSKGRATEGGQSDACKWVDSDRRKVRPCREAYRGTETGKTRWTW